ncbi:MAG: hypothetical protein ACOCZS_03920 [Verrucomicrobiota bacterium]
MNMQLEKLLNWLSSSIDPPRQQDIARRYQRALDYQDIDRPPLVFSFPYPESADFQPYPHREIFDDPEKMLYNELVYAFGMSIALNTELGADLPLTVRANFGTVLTASMFGATIEQRDDNPPWVRPDSGNTISAREVAEKDPTAISNGWIERAADTMQKYHELLAPFPALKEQVIITLPDLQGPLDNLELLCGSETFLALTTEPDDVDAALTNLATAQVCLYRYFNQLTTEPENGYCHQHGVMSKGNILIRNDSAIMVSPQMYREQISPHDERVLRECGGGGIHACGRCDHLTDTFLEQPSLQALDLGQPELNDVNAIYQQAAAHKIPLIRLAVSEDELISGRAFDEFPTGAVLIHRADSFDRARDLLRRLDV